MSPATVAALVAEWGLTEKDATRAATLGLTGPQAAELARLDADEQENTPFQSDDELVRAYPPKDRWLDPYWRLEYIQYGRRHQPSGGRTRATAMKKLALLHARVTADLDEELQLTPGDVILDRWLTPGQPQKGDRPWSEGTLAGHRWYVNTYMRPKLGALRAEEWGKHAYRAIVKSAPTRGEGTQVRRRLGALLGWSLRAGYIDERQVLALKGVAWEQPTGHVPRPQRWVSPDSEEGVLPEEDAMSVEDLAAIGDALQDRYMHGKLYAEFGAAMGLRQGEQFAVGADDVDLKNRRVKVLRQYNQKLGKITRPKMGKRRTALYVAGPTVTGYDLEDALASRVAEARAERDAGVNPRALLFPAPRGGYWNASNFDSRVWVPAMADAGVPYVEFLDVYRQGPRKGQPKQEPTRLYRYTCHSLRDRFAISALNIWGWTLDELRVVGGWKDSAVIFRRYYGVARGVLDRLQEKTALASSA